MWALGLRSFITARILAYLNRPLSDYAFNAGNDLNALRGVLKKGDVLLVQGSQRVSAIIRYLTQSSWSHAALYIGDELVRAGGEGASQVRGAFGDEADHLVIEALPEGVVVSPLSKYRFLRLRLCRARGLRREDADKIVSGAIATLGWRYDLQNVLDLARYLIPVRLVPNRLRDAALHFGSGKPTEVICSSHLGKLFHRVGFPILPEHLEGPTNDPGATSAALTRRARRGWVERVFGHRSTEYTGWFRMRHPTLMTPRDFDLSPYFDIIKFNAPDGDRFDYRKIHWVDSDDETFR